MQSVVFRNPQAIAQVANYEVTINRNPANNAPSTIFINPRVTNDGLGLSEEEWFTAAHFVLHRAVRQAIYAYNGWGGLLQNTHVSGIFQMRNDVDGHLASAHEPDLHLSNLSVEEFERIYYRITRRYPRNLHPGMVEWGYWIDPATLQVGGGGNTPQHVGLYKLTCKDIPEVSCAAAAITFWMIMNSNDPEYAPLKKNIQRAGNQRLWRMKAYEFQQKMGWDKITTKAQVLQAVQILKNYRIVIVQVFLPSSKMDSKEGEDYFEEEPFNNIIYLYYDFIEQHFSSISAVQHFVQQQRNNSSIRWCHICSSFKCDQHAPIPPRKRKLCQHCQQETYSLSQHNCFHQTCRDCFLEYRTGEEMNDHRCPINVNLKTRPTDFQTTNPPTDPKAKQLWAYDFESAIETNPNDTSSFVFEIDEEGYYRFIEEKPGMYTPICQPVPAHHQKPNFVVYKNIFTGETRETESIREFLEDMVFKTNKGNNTLVAHNASGYDSRLIFDELNCMTLGNKVEIIPRGSKILRMAVGKTIFIDSMMHLSGSLKSLAKDCLTGNADYEQQEKGYFPHLFNTPQNRNYIGPTPDKKYYDLTSFVHDDKELKAFNDYYDSIKDRQDWNFWEELTKYCRQDVDILSSVMKIFHDQCIKAVTSYSPHLNISPWHYTTAPGYVHKLFLYNEELEHGSVKPVERAQDAWCVLKPNEYYFARRALRGGRTETRMYYYEGPILDIDINSQYPSVQMAKNIDVCGSTLEILYPVGYPTIEIHDKSFFPCNLHNEHPEKGCNCTFEKKQQYQCKKLRIVEMDEPIADLHEYINNFFGILLVDTTPPKDLYHPVLPIFDEKEEKCIYSCKPIIRGVFCSPELQLAIKKGYIITKIYRADRYKSAPSSWGGEDGGLLGVFLKMKIMNSSKVPPLEKQQEIAEYYKKNFEMDLDFTPELWDKRDASKKCSKILCNSGWGKHAETVDHDQVTIVTPEGVNDGLGLIESFKDGKNQLSSFQSINNNNMLVKYKANRRKCPPDLTKAYLPCAVFVPMYGRLMLYNILDKYQKKVIMMDTDSIKVANTTLQDAELCNVPLGNFLGQWENESKADPLVGFISVGPKSYGQKFRSGKTSFKCKGVTLKRAHRKYINYESAKEIYFNGAQIDVPQTVFGYQFGKGISTRGFLKTIKFDEKTLKGKLNREDNCLYPHGYVEEGEEETIEYDMYDVPVV